MIEVLIKTVLFYGLVACCIWGFIPGQAKPNNDSIREFNQMYIMSEIDNLQRDLERGKLSPEDIEEAQEHLEDIETLQFLDTLDDL